MQKARTSITRRDLHTEQSPSINPREQDDKEPRYRFQSISLHLGQSAGRGERRKQE
jgi:hypothetical protein